MASSKTYNRLAYKAQRFQRIAKKVDYINDYEKTAFHLSGKIEKFIAALKKYNGTLHREEPLQDEISSESPMLTDLSCLTNDFKELKINDGMVLDGFYAGLPGFGYHMKLHVRKKENAKLFTPPDWHDNVIHLDPKIQEDRIKHLQSFNHDMYIREGVHYQEEKYLNLELWNQMTVPFNETGIWEATLLYIAPYILPRFWHANYDAFELICCDSNISRHKPDSIYLKDQRIMTETNDTAFEGATSDLNRPIHNRLIPAIFINEDTALVRLAIWGWNGLESLTVEVKRVNETIRIENSFRIPLEYFKNDIIY